MSINLVIYIAHIVLVLLLVLFVCVQSQEGGISSAVGSIGSYRSKRGLEKFIFFATLVVGLLFCASSFIQLYL